MCSYECTYCAACADRRQNVCPHCGGELARRPRRENISAGAIDLPRASEPEKRTGMVWLASFGVWGFISLAATFTIYEMYRKMDGSMNVGRIAGMEFTQILTYAPLTPFAFAFAMRFPLQRNSWLRSGLSHFAASLLFTFGHIALKAPLPYGFWDPKYREWSSAIWDAHEHAFRPLGTVATRMFFANVVDDVTSGYISILLVAMAIMYYRRYRERELQATQLEGQLAKARLQSLKSQLQPHFLFNTMHSISALMLTDVQAADRMMTRLSDLLRISMENAGTQITTLNKELEFANCYLEIEKVRFEERLNVILDIAPEALDAQVPHLLLQPLVDNAVKHGISKLPEGGEIHITVKPDGDDLQFEVHDNGPGIGPAKKFSTQGLGLRVTRERLDSLYGSNHSLELLSPPEGGVTIRVRIPFRLQPEQTTEDETPAAVLRETG